MGTDDTGDGAERALTICHVVLWHVGVQCVKVVGNLLINLFVHLIYHMVCRN